MTQATNQDIANWQTQGGELWDELWESKESGMCELSECCDMSLDGLDKTAEHLEQIAKSLRGHTAGVRAVIHALGSQLQSVIPRRAVTLEPATLECVESLGDPRVEAAMRILSVSDDGELADEARKFLLATVKQWNMPPNAAELSE